jgi:hypothetical protein
MGAALLSVLRPFVPSAPPPWTPGTLSGLALDLRPETGVYTDSGRTTPAAAGDPLGGWADQSGAGHHATQSTAGRYGIVRASGLGGGARPRIEFDGTNDGALLTGWGLGAGAQTAAIEFARRAIATSVRPFSVRGGGFWSEIAFVDFGGYADICLRFGTATGGSGAAVGWSPTLGTTRHTLIVCYDGSAPGSTSAYAVYLDGSLVTLSSTGVLVDSALMGGIGSYSDGSAATPLDCGRVVAWTADHRASVADIEAWLGA